MLAVKQEPDASGLGGSTIVGQDRLGDAVDGLTSTDTSSTTLASSEVSWKESEPAQPKLGS